MPRPKTFPLNIYKLTDTIVDLNLMVAPTASHISITIPGVQKAELFFKAIRQNDPKWKQLFKQKIDSSEIETFNQLKNSIAGMLLMIEMRDEKNAIQRYALAYGSGYHILKPEFIEERFGMKCALNAAESSQVRSIDYKSYSRNPLNHRTQAGQATDILACGIDSNGDFLCSVTCTIDKKHQLGNRATGKDKLGLSLGYTVDDIPAYLRKIESLSNSDEYKEKYSWVDNLREVNNPLKIKELNEQLATDIKENQWEKHNALLLIPEIIDFGEILEFKYSCNTSKRYDYIDFSDYLKSKKEPPTLDDLKKDKVFALDDSGSTKLQWNIWKCLYYEASKDRDSFVLSNGKWFNINQEFIESLDREIRQIRLSEIEFEPWTKEFKTENDYNTYLAKAHEGWVLADKDLVSHGGPHSKIELCDLIIDKTILVHVKKYIGSAVLSHLFAQGANSAELLLMDTSFCKKARKDLSIELNDNGLVDASRYEILFLIASKAKTDPISLPLFSKLVMRHTCRSLKGYGYKVSLKFVSWNDRNDLKP